MSGSQQRTGKPKDFSATATFKACHMREQCGRGWMTYVKGFKKESETDKSTFTVLKGRGCKSAVHFGESVQLLEKL